MPSGAYIGAHLSPNNEREEGRSSVKIDHGVEARVSEIGRFTQNTLLAIQE